jgi:hypothetical protein
MLPVVYYETWCCIAELLIRFLYEQRFYVKLYVAILGASK